MYLQERLEAAKDSSPPVSRVPIQTSTISHTGRRGRPKIILPTELLSYALLDRGPSELEGVFQCDRRTIRRRALEAGIVQPGHPVFSWAIDEAGDQVLVHTSQSKPVSTLSDEDLDTLVRSIQSQIREIGWSQLQGALLRQGHRVPKSRVTCALLRINGVPGIFGNRPPKCRKYVNRAPLACVHHDGQHGNSGFYVFEWSILIAALQVS